MRVVLDTNIFISALAFPQGQAARAVDAAAEGRYQLLLSYPIIHEVLDVLARKFDRDAEALSRVAVFLADLGERVEPRRRLHVLRDEPDNRILECAVAGGAEAIVTGDRAMLALAAYKGVQIVTLRQFLAQLA
ncbi:MAG: putative toxin-antitoxin system toxin component, PIN family [Betaproteobacteria bacterium RIFCSPLOWO2_12_FULL_66_14]|nr:MAG: putative toxin-antitoxin system toxin component, PIN family [Betaproteobacteria bacterium RIFCSPLOWO2_12_FULL_66_14]